ncbi:RRM [Saccharomyces cerevisiae]|uniref:K7_Ngr1p n=1 Tax=Saccharomyces cerevisiae (strain Kyokai no. 7 / NBRC 101557) TaxID=721032 RepID=G2W9L5_YEASK|nr:Ngr1p [Saccharomyces cerevisiae YJM1592]AJQ14751.1 Ngr1p [Saccharomyces cerevisiae YJM1387]AJQ15126.1 Ngr1p [Saccharomyces cerevisiae YJM1388]CAI4276778.1 ADQ_G0004000.mRNA.1.CDS.1 [Saccharomyces cerevisiae]GAA21758.1 K7_Ngr1p [Saccharomyces cerevisiae Kyokai no. 7]
MMSNVANASQRQENPYIIPLPPSSTVETSTEPPRTLWMGDLDPSFDEATIEEIWSKLDKKVIVKLIRAKKNLLIPCSSTSSSNNNTSEENAENQQSASNSTDQLDNSQMININGISFIDPSTTQLHHAGYCFVEFETQKDAKFALSLNATPLPNFYSPTTNSQTNPTFKRTFRLNWASGATLQSSIPSTPEFSLFVGDLSPTATEADLLSLFQTRFKSVKTVRVMTDPLTGSSRCFGFVRFGDEDERRRALIEMSGKWFQGRALRVAYATPRNNMMLQLQEQQQQQQQLQQQHQQLDQEDNNGPLLIKTANNLIQNNSNMLPLNALHNAPPMHLNEGGISNMRVNDSLPSNTYNTDPTNTTVFVGGLVPKTTEFQLRSLFKPFGPILNVRIPNGKNCGFVKFEKRIDAEASIQGLQGFIVGGSPIRLSWGRPSSSNAKTNSTIMGASQYMSSNGLRAPSAASSVDNSKQILEQYAEDKRRLFLHQQQQQQQQQPDGNFSMEQMAHNNYYNYNNYDYHRNKNGSHSDLVNLQRSNVPYMQEDGALYPHQYSSPSYSLHPTGNQFSNATNNLPQFGNAMSISMQLPNGNSNKTASSMNTNPNTNMIMNSNMNMNMNANPVPYGMGNGANMYDVSRMMTPPLNIAPNSNNSKSSIMNKHPNRNNVPPIHPSLLH